MSYSVQNLKNDLTGVTHNTQLNQITNLDGVIDRAARQLLLDVDPQETKRTLEFTNPIFNTVCDYPIAPDVKGNKIIDIKPQVRRLPRDIWSQTYNQAFDVWKQNIWSSQDMFTINFNTGVKTLKVNAPFLNPPIIVNYADSISNNGTWAVGGTGSNLSVDNVNFVMGQGSLKFDATTGNADVTNSTMSAVNLASYVNQSSLFVWVYVPTGADLNSVFLDWGSSNVDLYEVQVMTNQQGTTFVNGWNLCQFNWNGATVIGSPDPTSITFVSVVLDMTANATACRVNGVTNILGSILEYEYYSKYMFRDAITGAFQENVTDNSNLINLDTESYNMLFNLVAFYAIQQQQGADALAYDGSFFGSAYQQAIARYKAMYKSEVQKPQSVYYNVPNKSYSQFLGRGWYQ